MSPLLIGLWGCGGIGVIALICLFTTDFSVSDPWDDKP